MHLIITLYTLNLHILYVNNISIKLGGKKEKKRNSGYKDFEGGKSLVNLRNLKHRIVADTVGETEMGRKKL